MELSPQTRVTSRLAHPFERGRNTNQRMPPESPALVTEAIISRLYLPIQMRPLITAAVALSCILVALSIAIFGLRLASGGWTTIAMFVPNLLLVLCNLIAGVWCVIRSPRMPVVILCGLSLSAVLVVLELQTDYGDGTGRWVAYMALVDSSVGDTGEIPLWHDKIGVPMIAASLIAIPVLWALQFWSSATRDA